MNINFPQFNERDAFFSDEFPWENIFKCACCGSTDLRVRSVNRGPAKTVEEKEWGEWESDRTIILFCCKECRHESELMILEKDSNVAMLYKPSMAFFDKLNKLQKQKRKGVKPSIRFFVLKRDNYTCKACGATSSDGVKLEIDHIVPVSKGGTNDPDNLQVLCKTCNIGKSDKY